MYKIICKNNKKSKGYKITGNIKFHEAGFLKLNCDKALFDLKWQPTLKFEDTVRMTVEWYKFFYDNQNISMFEYTLTQIDEYMKFAKSQNMTWTL